MFRAEWHVGPRPLRNFYRSNRTGIAVAIDGIDSLTGVVLAGGRAERMDGRDKGLLSLAGEPLIAHVVRRLRPQVGKLLISANRNLEAYRRYGYRVVHDDEHERFRGPLAGVLAAMRVADTPYLLVAPCDSPLLPSDYARRMRAALARKRATLGVAFYGGCWQPVFALLPVELKDDLAAYLAAGGGSAGRWLRRHRPAPVEFADDPALFCNVNTPEDLMRLESDRAVASELSRTRDREYG